MFVALGNRGLYKTVDGGSNWVAVNEGLTCPVCQSISCVSIDPSRRQTIYACAYDAVSVGNGGVFRSDDGGMTWTSASDGLRTWGSRMVWDLLVDPRDSRHVYIATDDGVYQNHGGGESWLPMNEGMSALGTFDIALDPDPPGASYAITGAGAFTRTPLSRKEPAKGTRAERTDMTGSDVLDE